MLPDAECVKVMSEILESLELGQFQIRINHRKLLDGVFEFCGVPAEKFRAISSAVDKLDKCSWEEVRKEMIDEKGLEPDVADSVHQHISFKGRPTELLHSLKSNEKFMSNENTRIGLETTELLMKYCLLMGVEESCLNFDLSLARGLDYYTGLIYEAILISKSRLFYL